MPRACRDGVGLAYEVEPATADDGTRDDDTDRAPIVLVPGVELGRWAWRWQRDAVRGKRRLLAPALRGTGPRLRTDGGVAIDDGARRSDAGFPPLVPSLPGPLRRPIVSRGDSATVAALADDLAAVIADDSAFGRGRSQDVHLVGQGLGGAIALEYAIEHGGVRSLTLVGTRHGGPGTPETPDSVRSQALDPDGVGRTRRRNRLRPFFAADFLARNPHLFARIVDWQADQGPDAATREAQWAAWDRDDPTDRLDDVPVPTLVVHGTADRLVPVEHGHALAEAIPESTIELLEGCGHTVGVEAADRVAARLTTFVDSVE
ncbi:putative hydrolase or acyltransferase of alpha/beta superfamily [Halovivax ruber XH-70]|uniref:Putative hydrolase or acyltransferase of alpha/beta superfamily n=1 Tax=Halovivax ruber (strain DSM 18193 / JCM 13892 / XH-70) TaxID=797302 RepID=L0I5T6_HALRX|nr:alpha/beta hydrolase [Halovivax ruber]AGB14880.1 putative hydrolase or acyltransferase of alpha/beta superfamily [Halovivax ruber XH-70]